MKIIILTDVYLPYLGGGQLYLSNIVSRFCQKTDVQIEIVTRKLIVDGQKIDKNEEMYHGRLRIKRLGCPAVWNNIFARVSYIFLAIFYLLNKKFDLIDAQVFVGAIPGKIISILRKKPIILTIHGTTLETGRSGIIEKTILTKIKYNAQISAASNFIKFKNVNKNVFVVNPGVDMNFYKPDFSKKEKNIILFVGRLQKIKGTEVLLQCINMLIHSRYKWVIVGNGEEMDRMKNQIKINKIESVEFKGSLSREETLREYQKASIFVLPSFSEGFPLTILEAMACGLPVVATDVGDVKEMIKQGKNGFLIKPGNFEELSKKIMEILTNENLRKKMSENNVETSRLYSWSATSDKIKDLYFSLFPQK